MTKEQLIEFLKENLNVEISLDQEAYIGPVISFKLFIKDEEICSTRNSVSMDVFKSDGEYF